VTAQVADCIKFEWRYFAMSCEPLGDWLMRKKNRHIRFRRVHTACSRGYRAEWEIHRGRLYMTRFRARQRNGRFAGFKTLLANYSEQFYETSGLHDPENKGPGLFAFWFSGTISCRFGKLLHYEHHGYDSTYEGQLLLFFEKGFLIGQRIVHYKPIVSQHSRVDFDPDHEGQDTDANDG
jgi:hypothetical protein